jgi:hypothetical protein
LTLDAQERNMLTRLHSKITNYDFNQDDIYSLLMLLRNHCDRDIKEHIPIVEFADFIAHRKKNKGVIKNFLENIVQYSEMNINTH